MRKRWSFVILGGVLIFLVGLYSVSAQVFGDCSDNQVIMRLAASENSHAAFWDQQTSVYTTKICYDDFFEGTFSGSPRGAAAGTVLRLNALYNSHAEALNESSSSYSNLVKYGDLVCNTQTSATMPAGAEYPCQSVQGGLGTVIVRLSKSKNAHVSLGSDRDYPVYICCKSEQEDPICNYNEICEQELGETPENCPSDCITGGDLVQKFDFQGAGSLLQPGWTEVLPEAYAPEKGFGWKSASGVSATTYSGTATELEASGVPSPKAANADAHLLTGTAFKFKTGTISPAKYELTVYTGASAGVSNGYSVVYKKSGGDVNLGSGSSLPANDYEEKTFEFEIDPETEEVELDFVHPAGPMYLTGLVVSSFCGDGTVQSPEDCDDGHIDTPEELELDAGACIIDAGEDGIQCENARCGDSHFSPSEGEECDDGNINSGDGCSSSCEIECNANGIVEPGEDCDPVGPKFNSNKDSCEEVTSDKPEGSLGCTDQCTFNTSACQAEAPPQCILAYRIPGGSQVAINSCDDYNKLDDPAAPEACECLNGKPDSPAENDALLLLESQGVSVPNPVCNVRVVGSNKVCEFRYDGPGSGIPGDPYQNPGSYQCSVSYDGASESCTEDQAFRQVSYKSMLVQSPPLSPADRPDLCSCNGIGGSNVCSKEIPCPFVVQLPFFGFEAMILSVAAIAILYLMIFGRREAEKGE